MFVIVKDGSAIVNLDLCSKVAVEGHDIRAFSPESMGGSTFLGKGARILLGDYKSEEQARKVLGELTKALKDGRKTFYMPETAL